MTTNTNTTRRAVIAALAGTPIFAGTIAAGISEAAEAAPTAPTDTGAEIAMLHVARAWVDRWRAAGGDFGAMFPRGEGRGHVIFGSLDPSFWTPTDADRADLPPHVRLTEERHPRGALRALEGLLILTPGLREAVIQIVGTSVLNREA